MKNGRRYKEEREGKLKAGVRDIREWGQIDYLRAYYDFLFKDSSEDERPSYEEWKAQATKSESSKGE